MKNLLRKLRAGSSNVEVQSIGFRGLSSLAGLPPRTFKFLAVPQHSIIVLISVLGIISLIGVNDFITLPAHFDPIFLDTMHLANFVMGIKGKGFIIYDAENRYDVRSYYYFRYSES